MRSIAAAVFAGGCILISGGLICAALKTRGLTQLDPAAFMIAAAITGAFRYTSPIGWICVSEVLLTGAFLLHVRHLFEADV